MKTLTLLEGNMDLGGIVVMIIGILLIVVFVVSLVVAAIAKVIYEWDNTKKFTTGQFWRTVLISMLIGGLISGFVCGGM
jgi:ABC-type Fe3+ transport system permease subunit